MENPKIVCGSAILRYSQLHRNVELLTIFKRKTSRYEFPVGKIELEENPYEATVRETKEEVGAEIRALRDEPSKYRFDTASGPKEIWIYPSRIISGEPRIAEPDKFERLLWLPIHHYRGRVDLAPYVRDFARDNNSSAFNEAFKGEIFNLEGRIQS